MTTNPFWPQDKCLILFVLLSNDIVLGSLKRFDFPILISNWFSVSFQPGFVSHRRETEMNIFCLFSVLNSIRLIVQSHSTETRGCESWAGSNLNIFCVSCCSRVHFKRTKRTLVAINPFQSTVPEVPNRLLFLVEFADDMDSGYHDSASHCYFIQFLGIFFRLFVHNSICGWPPETRTKTLKKTKGQTTDWGLRWINMETKVELVAVDGDENIIIVPLSMTNMINFQLNDFPGKFNQRIVCDSFIRCATFPSNSYRIRVLVQCTVY